MNDHVNLNSRNTNERGPEEEEEEEEKEGTSGARWRRIRINPKTYHPLACQADVGQTRIERPRRPNNTNTMAGERREDEQRRTPRHLEQRAEANLP